MKECKMVGVDGLIIPDLPPEEADYYLEKSREFGISSILLVAPNTSDQRIKEIDM